jgi:hypothetical protein
MREYRKRKQLEGNDCNNVPKRTKLTAEAEDLLQVAYLLQY